MKRSAFLLSFLFVGFFAVTAIAEEQYMDPNMEMPREEGQPRERQGGEGMGKMGGKKMGMMHQQPTMVVTADGGVLVLSGNKLAKYDANLTLVNEVELKGGPSPDMKRKERPAPPASEEAPKEEVWEAPVAPEPDPAL